MMGTFATAFGLAAFGVLALAILYRLRQPEGRRRARLAGGAFVLFGLVLAPFSFSHGPAGVCGRQTPGAHALTAALCAAIHAAPGAARTARVKAGQQLLQVEIADTPREAARGLMFRRSLAPRHGMLFLYSRDRRYPYWMKNTKIPLDMLFFDRQGRLQDVLRNVPPCKIAPCPLYYPSHAYRYVIELPAGEARRLGLKPGDQLAPAVAG